MVLIVLDQLIAVREECREKNEVESFAKLGRGRGVIKVGRKAVLIAVYMTNGPQTKCKTCFGGPRMILHAL